jgi:hypothetical protein
MPTVAMQVKIWVTSSQPAKGVFTSAGTCPGRYQRHCVIGYADVLKGSFLPGGGIVGAVNVASGGTASRCPVDDRPAR